MSEKKEEKKKKVVKKVQDEDACRQACLFATSFVCKSRHGKVQRMCRMTISHQNPQSYPWPY